MRQIKIIFVLSLVAMGAAYLATRSMWWTYGAALAVIVPVTPIVLYLQWRGPRLAPGSRAWESKQTALLLFDVINDRRRAWAAETDVAGRARLGREIEFLAAQFEHHAAITRTRDPSPGCGRIGFIPYSGD